MNDSAYLGLRHYCPDLVRMIRGALDARMSAKKIKNTVCKNINKFHAKKVCAAIDYMSANPSAGVVRWTEGEQYVFVEQDK